MATKTEQKVVFDTTGLLGIAFVVLKLCGVIHWSWWLVTLPFWGAIAVAIVLFVIAGILASIGTLIELIFVSPAIRRRRKKQRAAADALDAYAKSLSRRNRV